MYNEEMFYSKGGTGCLERW